MPSGHVLVARLRRSRLVLLAATVALAVPVVVLPTATTASALAPTQYRVPGFSLGTGQDTNMPDTLTNFVYLPSGRILAINKTGQVRLGTWGGPLWSPVTFNPKSPINSDVDRGLVGLAIANDYATSGTVFLMYDYNQNGCAPKETPAAINNVCGRLSRLTVDNPAAPTAFTSETPIMNFPAFSAYGIGNDQSHTVGTVLVAPDNTLFVGNGDSTSFDPEHGGGGSYDPTSFFAQDKTSLRGKIFHVDSNGNGVSSNPFWDGNSGDVQSKVYAYGLRNPFRFSLKPGTSTLYIGDVGSGEYEEIDVAHGGENFGWPCYEGPLDNRNEFSGDPFCANQYNAGTAGITGPLVTYAHGPIVNGVMQPEGVGHAIIGGDFYTGVAYGPLNGAYFFADAPYGVIYELQTDANDNLIHGPVDRTDWFIGPPNTDNQPPNGGVGIPVALHPAPNGNIDIADLASSQIFELKGCTTGCPPVPRATVNPIGGPPDTTVFTFDGSKSYDPEGGALTYTWDFGDGTAPASGAVQQHVYTTKANFTAHLTVSDGVLSATADVPVTTLHSPPSIRLVPDKQGSYAVGVPVTMTALAFDDTGQQLTGNSITWELTIHHCPDLCHIHPTTPTPQPTGVSFTIVAPNHGTNFYLTFSATATASYGLPSTVSCNLQVGSNPVDNPVCGSGLYTPVEPYRLFDTRLGGGAPLMPGQVKTVNLSAEQGSPSAKTAVLLNVTTDQPQAAGYVKAFPCGTEPSTSTVNFDPGQTAANLAMVQLPPDDRVCFTSLVPTHVIVDVSGWFAPAEDGGVGYTTIPPERVLDTRSGAALQPMQELHFSLAGKAGFPADATAALLNLTATNTAAPGYVRVYPCGQELEVSNVNYAAGQTVANLASVKVAPGGNVCFRSFAQADIVVDLAGWYAPTGTGSFSAASPVRLFDTRSTPGVSRLAPGKELAFQVGGGQVPAFATSVALNVTAAAPDGDGYVKVYPCGSGDPLVSNVNYRAGQVAAANLAVVKLPADGRVCFRSFAGTDLVVDLAGWYTG
jgi:glucose/arabinose dehydrogenase